MDDDIKKLADLRRKEFRKAEAAISNNLFLVCAIVTLSTMALTAVDFFARGSFLPTSIGFFYLTVLLIYSLHKEFIRWLGEKRASRHGEYFIYAWVILTTALYVVNFFSNGYYGQSKEGYPVPTLANSAYITIEVLAIFVIMRIIKIYTIVKRK